MTISRLSARGFTLVEMFIVMGALAILAAMVVPHIAGAADTSADRALRAQLHAVRGQIARHDATSATPFDPLTQQWDQLIGQDLIVKAPRNPLRDGGTSIAAAAAPGVAWVWADLDGTGARLYAVDNAGGIFTDPETGSPY